MLRKIPPGFWGRGGTTLARGQSIENIAFVHRFISSLVFTDTIETVILILLIRIVLRNRTMPITQMVALY
jgi:hypothetical protein